MAFVRRRELTEELREEILVENPGHPSAGVV
jgi:hypothetical protein